MLRWILLLACGVAGGCYSPMPLSGPGTADRQRERAIWFDPYPDPDAGPEVVGGRPLDYARPVPETIQAQQYSPAPPPSTYRGTTRIAPGATMSPAVPAPFDTGPAGTLPPSNLPPGSFPPGMGSQPMMRPARY